MAAAIGFANGGGITVARDLCRDEPGTSILRKNQSRWIYRGKLDRSRAVRPGRNRRRWRRHSPRALGRGGPGATPPCVRSHGARWRRPVRRCCLRVRTSSAIGISALIGRHLRSQELTNQYSLGRVACHRGTRRGQDLSSRTSLIHVRHTSGSKPATVCMTSSRSSNKAMWASACCCSNALLPHVADYA